MGYREIAERQHGFILPCQLTDEEFIRADMSLTAKKSSNYFSKNTRQGSETRMNPRRLGIRVSNQGF